MPRLQQVTAFSSLVGILLDRPPEHRQLRNTKMELGKRRETSSRLAVIMVSSPQDLPQWLLVAFPIVGHRKFIFERVHDLIAYFKHKYGIVGTGFHRRPYHQCNLVGQLRSSRLIFGR